MCGDAISLSSNLNGKAHTDLLADALPNAPPTLQVGARWDGRFFFAAARLVGQDLEKDA